MSQPDIPVLDHGTRMEYVANTNVLRIEARCGEGRFDVFDDARGGRDAKFRAWT